MYVQKLIQSESKGFEYYNVIIVLCTESTTKACSLEVFNPLKLELNHKIGSAESIYPSAGNGGSIEID